MVRLNATGAASESDIAGGQNKPPAGRYLAILQDADESLSKGDYVTLNYQILAGTVPGQRGKTIDKQYHLSEKAAPSLTRVAVAIGLMHPGAEADVEFVGAVGWPLIIEIEPHEYENKAGKKVQTVQVGFAGAWSPTHPDVAEVLTVPEVLAALNEIRVAWGWDPLPPPVANQAGRPPVTPPSPHGPATGALRPATPTPQSPPQQQRQPAPAMNGDGKYAGL